MKVKINITTEGNQLTVQDLSKYLNPNEDGPTLGEYFKKDIIPLIILESHKSNNPVNKHIFDNTISIDSDGWYTIHYIIIPTQEWFNNTKNRSEYGDILFYTDGEKVYDENNKIIDFKDLITYCTNLPNVSTNAYCAIQEWISFTNLYECYINLCQ